MKTITLHVSGTHCNSCKILIEDILADTPDITNAEVNLKKEIITFETNSTENQPHFVAELNNVLGTNGYAVSTEKITPSKNDTNVIWQALPLGIIFLTVFILLQKSGMLNFGLDGSVTPITSFIIGLIASVSSCLAVVGGLVLSLSATVAQDTKSDTKPIALFHSGRLLSFALLGGILGAVGGALGVNFTVGAILGIIASTVMIILGLNLVGVFEKSNITLPTNLFNFFRRIEHQTLAPFILGVGTFFLPCGFTQSMQLAALSSESFLSGMFIMLGFALGTLPVLALLSFGSASFAKSKYAPLFFKSAGVVVIGLGTLSLLAGLAGLGIIPPLFTI